MSRCCSSAKIASLPSTSASGLTEEGTSPKSMPSVKLFPSPSSPTIKSTSTKLLRRNQGHPHFLRPLPSRRGSQAERAEEVRRTRSQSPLPEILSLIHFMNLRLDPTHFCALLYVSTQSSSSVVVVPIPSVRRFCFLEALFLS